METHPTPHSFPEDRRAEAARKPAEGASSDTKHVFESASMEIDRANMVPIDQQLEMLTRGAVQVTEVEELRTKLESGRPLVVKLGCDPSRPDLHLGHCVVLKKLRDFQDLGHRVVLLIGDFTATIGDPTGRSKTRPALSLEETQQNGLTYIEQATRVLDPDPKKLTVVKNSEWLRALTFEDVIRLCGKYTVSRMLERDDFHSRFNSEQPISLHEFLYPLVQAWDSVHLHADVEIGGTDQTFNLLVGRDIQRAYQQPAQVVIVTPLLVGIDGREKMSKSLGNYIALNDPPEVMYEKLMRVPDELLSDYARLLTSLPIDRLRNVEPVEAHRILAREIVGWLCGTAAVAGAEERYDAVSKGGIPENLPVVRISPSLLESDQTIRLARLLVLAGLASSNGDARRLIEGKGIKVQGSTVEDPATALSLTEPVTLQRGKNKFVRVEVGHGDDA